MTRQKEIDEAAWRLERLVDKALLQATSWQILDGMDRMSEEGEDAAIMEALSDAVSVERARPGLVSP